MTDYLERLRTALADRYRIEREIDRGGMATVYLARDLKHDRDVAIKVLRPDVAQSVGSHRFLREIEIAAKLSHPNILALHDSGDAAGVLYYVMPFVPEGSVANWLLDTGPPTIENTVRMLRDIADALDYAHRRRVVHRDIKPPNVMRSGRHFLVADFGIAKALRDATDVTNPTLLGPIGTPAYMAPEQALGDPNVDHRADIYALGVLAYEMLTGRTPFQTDDPNEMMRLQVSETPPPISVFRSDVPRRLTNLVERCLAKDPDDRCQTVGEFLTALDRVSRPAGVRPVAAGVVLGAAGLAAAAAVLTSSDSNLVRERVVVGAFENHTGDSTNGDLGSFAAHWITQGLQRTQAVEVVPTPTAQQSLRHVQSAIVAGEEQDPIRALADETGAGTVISGFIYDDEGRLRLRVEITDAERGALIGGFTTMAAPGEAPSDAIDRMRQRVMGSLAVTFDERLSVPPTGLSAPPPLFAAYRAFNEGMHAYTRTDYGRSIPHFARARTIDSAFALPLLFEALGHLNLADWSQADSVVQVLDAYRDGLSEYHRHWLAYLEARLAGDDERALEAMRHASEMAPVSKATYNRALMALRTRRPEEALEALRALDPNRGPMHDWLPYWNQRTWALHSLGRFEAELSAARTARAQHPDRMRALQLETDALATLGRFDALDSLLDEAQHVRTERIRTVGFLIMSAGREARAHGFEGAADSLFARAVNWYESQPPPFMESLVQRHRYGIALYQARRFQDVERVYRQILSESEDHVGAHLYLGLVAARRGDRETVEQMSRWLSTLGGPYQFGVPAWNRARMALLVGDREEALALLQQSMEEGRGVRRFRPHTHIDFESIRGTPDYRRLFGTRG